MKNQKSKKEFQFWSQNDRIHIIEIISNEQEKYNLYLCLETGC